MTQEQNDMQALAITRAREIDRMDEAQIIQEIAGDAVKEYVYQFRVEGKDVRGLSWAGFKELAFMRGNIHIGKPVVEDGGDYWRVLVEATDLERNVTFWAGTHQPKSRRINLKEQGGYKLVPNDFALETAISKAQRNVLKNLIPYTIQERAIEAVLSGKSMSPIQGQAKPPILPRQGRREALPQSSQSADSAGNIATLAQLWNRGMEMGYKNRAEMMGALNIRNDAEVGDLNEALATLRALKVPETEKPEPTEEDLKRDAEELFGGR